MSSLLSCQISFGDLFFIIRLLDMRTASRQSLLWFFFKCSSTSNLICQIKYCYCNWISMNQTVDTFFMPRHIALLHSSWTPFNCCNEVLLCHQFLDVIFAQLSDFHLENIHSMDIRAALQQSLLQISFKNFWYLILAFEYSIVT